VPAQGTQTGRSADVEKKLAAKKKPAKKYTLPSAAPRGDAPQTRKQDFAKAEAHKQTPSYRHAIRTAYRNADEAYREHHIQAIIDHTRAGGAELGRAAQQRRYFGAPGQHLSAEDYAVIQTLLHRDRRDAMFMRGHAMGDRQTKLIDRFKDADQYRAALKEAFAHRPVPKSVKAHDVDLYEADRDKLLAAGFKPEGVLDKIAAAPGRYGYGALVSGFAVADATAHDPVGVPLKTAKQGVLAVTSIPGGLYDLATDPVHTVKEGVKAFGERSTMPYDERVKLIRKEGGFDFASDAAVVLGGASSATRLLRHGKGVSRAELRVSGGTALQQRGSHGLIVQAAQNALDRKRGAALERELAEAERTGAGMDAVRREAALANRKAGRIVEVVGPGNKIRQRRGVAKLRGRGVHRLRADQGRRIKAARQEINRLDKHEKRALWYAAVLGVKTADQARELLPRLAEKIKAYRKEHGIQVKGGLKRSDMLPDIEAILKNPEAHFTGKLSDVVEALRPDSLRAGREDPSFTAETAVRRRYSPQADLLDVAQGAIPGRDIKLKNGGDAYKVLGLTRDASQVEVKAAYNRLAREFHPDVNKSPDAGNRMKAINEAYEALGGEPNRAHYNPDETNLQHAQRVAAEARVRGLSTPLYFRSERHVGPRDFAAYALGGGRGAMKADKRYQGKNLIAGLQDTSGEAYLTGLARNIKRKHSWKLAADILDAHAIKSLAPSVGLPLKALRAKAVEDGVDLSSVAFVNLGVFRRAAQRIDDDHHAEDVGLPEEFNARQIGDALNEAAVDGDTLPPDHLAQTHGWQAVPITVMRELEAQTRPSSAAARMLLDIPKAKASRAILLAGNVPWLAFQVAGNAAMATAATGGRALNPANWVGAARLWRELNHHERDEVNSILGLDVTGSDSHQTKLGAAVSGGGRPAALVNAYRTFKAHPVFHTGVAKGRGPSVSSLNLFEAMARADRGQTNVFRAVAGFSKMKKQVVREMGKNMSKADRAQLKITSILMKPPGEQFRALIKDKQALEQMAESVADFMGDYTSLTSFERRVLGRATMFYPYTRYSLKLLFWTMPTRHPAVLSVLAELGQLRADELEKLFGSDQLPWNAGTIYFGHDGNVRSIDLKRAHPALNALLSAAGAENPGQLVGILPPYVGWAVDQATHRNNFKDKDWTVLGRAAGFGMKHKDFSVETRSRILLNSAISLYFPKREVEKLVSGGQPLGDDSLLWDLRPTHYKGTTKVAKLKAQVAEKHAAFEAANESLIGDLIPLLPQPDDSTDPQVLAREKRIKKLEARTGKQPRGYNFDGSSRKKSYFRPRSGGGYDFD
jgi:hypothetical protein